MVGFDAFGCGFDGRLSGVPVGGADLDVVRWNARGCSTCTLFY